MANNPPGPEQRATLKEQLLEEYRRYCKEHGDDAGATGAAAFARAVGKSKTLFNGHLWPSWNAFRQEAGFAPRTFGTGAFSNEDLLRHLARLTREHRGFPTVATLKFEIRQNPQAPSEKTLRNRFRNQEGMIGALRQWVSDKHEWKDVADLLASRPATRAAVAVANVAKPVIEEALPEAPDPPSALSSRASIRAKPGTARAIAAVQRDDSRGPSQTGQSPPAHDERAGDISAPGAKSTEDRRRVFVIHGRDEAARRAIFDFLRALHLLPIEWEQARAQTGKGSPYIGEILDAAFDSAQAVIALFTGDDEARLRPSLRDEGEPEEPFTAQARANVLFEAGMAMGRQPERTIFVEIGRLRSFSDIGGRHILRFDGSFAKRQALAHRLQTAGCAVDMSGTDWHDAGDFKTAKPGVMTFTT